MAAGGTGRDPGALELTSSGMGLPFPTAAVLATVGVAPGDRGLASGYRLSYLVGAAVTACALAGVLLLLPAGRDGTRAR